MLVGLFPIGETKIWATDSTMHCKLLERFIGMMNGKKRVWLSERHRQL